MTEKATFEIGLTMAGAISAGAYSGGVFDFLCEALDEWQKAKDEGRQDIPNHDVCIKVMSGASAGSITAAIGTVALAQGLSDNAVEGKPGYTYRLKSLYQSWVIDPDLSSASASYDFLSLEDLADDKAPVTSVLNSRCLDKIAANALHQPARSAAYDWLGNPLHVYFTVTNLRGVPYRVEFEGPGGVKSGHYMMCHGDRVHFAIADVGSGGPPNGFCRDDPATALAKAGLGSATQEWQTFSDAALASAAFPVGLASRRITAALAEYGIRKWPSLTHTPVPYFPKGFPVLPATTMDYLAPDGGTIDNEPFQYAHSGIMLGNTSRNERDGSKATRAVIMVDPFPEPPDFEIIEKKALDASLLKLPGALITALKNQARFKPDEIADAQDNKTYSRFLISPQRSDDSSDLSSKPLATSLLGGFGGFIDQSFREHDYQLGRRNCQQFLRKYFMVKSDNPIAETWSADARKNFTSDDKTHIPIIPLIGHVADKIVLPLRPAIPYSRLKQIDGRIRTRANAVMTRLMASVPSRLLRWGLSVLWSTLARSRVLDFAHWKVLSELIRTNQLQEFQGLTDAERDAAAVLCDFDFDYRSAAALETALGGNPQYLVAKFTQTPIKLWRGTVDDQECYCWADLRPSFIERTLSGSKPKIG